MCSPIHVHLRGRKLRMRSKANNFIGGLHNSEAIPGVIVFPLRLSCRDESLMHFCLKIMDGMGQLLPNPTAGTESGGEMNGGERGERTKAMYGLWTESVTSKAKDVQESGQEDLSLLCKICQFSFTWAYLSCLYVHCMHVLCGSVRGTLYHNDLLYVYKLNFPGWQSFHSCVDPRCP